MANNEMTIKGIETVCNVSAVESLKSAALRKETLAFVQTLAEEQTLVDTTTAAVDALRKKQAPIIYRIQSGELYKKDGFKNMSEYAATIGLSDKSKSLISGLYAVGKVLSDKTAPESLKGMSASKIAQMGSLVRDSKCYEQVKKDAENGALDGMTLADVKSYTSSTKTAIAPSAKVVTTYTASVNGKAHEHGADTLDGWKSFWTADSNVEYVVLPKGKATANADKATVNRAAIISGNDINLVTYAAVITGSNKPAPVKTTTGKDEFLARARAEGMSEEAIKMAMRAMGWNK